MPDLYVRCKTCGLEFKTGIGATPESLRTSVFMNPHICPSGHVHTYTTNEYFFEKKTKSNKSAPILTEQQKSCEHEFIIEDRGIEKYLHKVCNKCGLARVVDRPQDS